MSDPNNPLTPRLNELEKKNHKNLIINGAFDFWQRGVSTPNITSASYLTADRFQMYSLGGSIGNIFRTTDSPIPEIKYSPVYSLTTTAIGGTGFTHVIEQRIESNMLYEVNNKVCTFSLYYKTANFEKILVVFNKFDSIDNASSVTEISQEEVVTINDNTWRRAVFTVNMPSDISDFGMSVVVNIGDSNSTGASDIRMTGLMLHEGEEVLPFVRAGRNYAEEYRLCRRYFRKDIYDSSFNYLGIYRDYGSPGGALTMPFVEKMRVAPVVTWTGATLSAQSNGLSTNIASFDPSPLAHNDTQIILKCNLSSEIGGTAGGQVEYVGGLQMNFNSEL